MNIKNIRDRIAPKRVLRVVKRLLPSYVVLMYHRISDEKDPYGISVSPKNFKEHVEVLKELKTIPLSRISEDEEEVLKMYEGSAEKKSKKHKWVRKKVIITFDDGYKDTISGIKELIKNKIPVTMFIATGFLGKRFWWDELKDIFLYSRFSEIEVDFGRGEKYSFKVVGNIPDGFLINPEIKEDFEPGRHIVRKDVLFSWLYRKLKYERKNVRDYVIESIKNRVIWESREKKEDSLKLSGSGKNEIMTEDDIVDLSKIGVEMGAHTVSHEVLSILTYEEQKREIEESKNALESILGRKVHSFSYPFGLPGDFKDETAEIVKNSLFKCACTGIKGQIFLFHPFRKEDVKFHIPRFPVLNWDKNTFIRKLREFFSL